MSALEQRLRAARDVPALAEREAAYVQALRDLVAAAPPAELPPQLGTFLELSVLEPGNLSGVGLIVGRNVARAVARTAAEEHARRGSALADAGVYRAVLDTVLGKLESHAATLEEELAEVRFQLADLLESQGACADAARVLRAVGTDGRQTHAGGYWLRLYVRLMELLLATGDLAGAELYAKKGMAVLHELPPEYARVPAPGGAQPAALDAEPYALVLRFRTVQARMYDVRHRFYDAAVRYYGLSALEHAAGADRAALLHSAVAAALLAPAGPRRSRLLAQLVRDPHTRELELYPVLHRAALRRVLRAADVAQLERGLAPHQLAADGPLRVVDQAVAEHNVHAAALVYANITLPSLAELLRLSPAQSEATVARMLAQGRLGRSSYVDQVRGLVHFALDDAPGAEATGADAEEGAGGAGGPAAPTDTQPEENALCEPDPEGAMLRSWDQRIRHATEALEAVHERLHHRGWWAPAAEGRGAAPGTST